MAEGELLTVVATSASVTMLTMVPGLGAAKSLHLGAVEALWEIVACGESNGFSPASMLTGEDEDEDCKEASMVSWALTLLQSKKAQKASSSILSNMLGD